MSDTPTFFPPSGPIHRSSLQIAPRMLQQPVSNRRNYTHKSPGGRRVIFNLVLCSEAPSLWTSQSKCAATPMSPIAGNLSAEASDEPRHSGTRPLWETVSPVRQHYRREEERASEGGGRSPLCSRSPIHASRLSASCTYSAVATRLCFNLGLPEND